MLSDRILAFYQSIAPPTSLTDDVEVMNPFKDAYAWQLTSQFYHKYFDDDQPRKILFGINPGRFGGGITGIPFTDPLTLEENCQISNTFQKRAELSSRFIYEMIEACGGAKVFYQQYFISAVSPLGYIKDGKNLNYYDVKDWKAIFYDYTVEITKQQLSLGIDTTEAFSIGQGENLKFLKTLNDEYQFFEKITPLPHPRWVMQYRLKRKQEFIDEYVTKLGFP